MRRQDDTDLPPVTSSPPRPATLPPPPPPSTGPHARLGDLLVESGAATREQVERVAREASSARRRLGEMLVEQHATDELPVYRALAAQRGLRCLELVQLVRMLDGSVIDAIPRAFLERHGVLPVARVGLDLLVATSNPDAEADDVAKALRARNALVTLVTPTDYRRLWMLADVRRGHAAQGTQARGGEAKDLLVGEAHDEDARFIALFEALLLEAIAERASDLHVERYVDEVRVRLRVDGDLRDLTHVQLSPTDMLGLVNVVKIAADLDIAERRLPQGGRVRRRAGGQVFDLRVQTQPALYGEHLVIRLLPQTTQVLTIEDLGFPTVLANDYRRLLDSPGGLLLVVGPTGSGKSTTLYAGLSHIARDATRKVITVEDPIEYAIYGVQQTPARAEIGFGFASAMRAFVREDPDVILVGEVRDAETALEAIRASQTGHLVLSTLHCNDAVDAVQRLLDLGMHANSIASELLAVVAQRLAKRVCPSCRAPAEPEPEIAAELFPAGPPPGFLCFRGKGCDACGGHGTKGRVAVTEYMRSSVAVRSAIAHGATVDELRQVALGSGLHTMRKTALMLVHEGIIPLSELPWVLPAERMAPEV